MSDDGERFEQLVSIASDHPAFDGHFPDAPVLPGVVLLSLVMTALAQAPALAARLGAAPQIDQVKFLRPVAPGQTLRISLRANGDHRLSFELALCTAPNAETTKEPTVCKGHLSAGPSPE